MAEVELSPENRENNLEQAQTESESYTEAPSGGAEVRCSPPCKKMMDAKMHPIEEQLQVLLSQADQFQTQLMYSRDQLLSFLHTCRPYFTYLESTARNSSPDRTPLPSYIRTRLLQISQQLCSRLEQLLLMYASFGCLSLEEADPLCISHFYIGQCVVDNIRLSIFRYCLPSPFLASTDSGLYKRMRWNVERERERETGEQGSSTEYYFLCCEDVPVLEEEGGEDRETRETREKDRAVVKTWSVGQWVQTYPDPHTEDIYEWILCMVPQGQYKQLVYLGKEEPSACIATDCLLGLLSSQSGPSISNTT